MICINYQDTWNEVLAFLKFASASGYDMVFLLALIFLGLLWLYLQTRAARKAVKKKKSKAKKSPFDGVKRHDIDIERLDSTSGGIEFDIDDYTDDKPGRPVEKDSFKIHLPERMKRDPENRT